ncbi:MAG: hypothetical protein LBC77_07020 [Spirochaetaceae bacterium]|jgi:hypothetical protein|nr:hypothetical protein [Spirochaetaceae bacterium]
MKEAFFAWLCRWKGRLEVAACCALRAGERLDGEKRAWLGLTCLAFLSIIAVGDYLVSGLSRRTIVFYAAEGGTAFVEERFIARTGSREGDIRAFVEEAALGPAEWAAAPLFDRAAALESLFVREGTVYAGLSEAAAFPVSGGRSLIESLRSVEKDIRRNFSGVRSVRFFIGGREIPRLGS